MRIEIENQHPAAVAFCVEMCAQPLPCTPCNLMTAAEHDGPCTGVQLMADSGGERGLRGFERVAFTGHVPSIVERGDVVGREVRERTANGLRPFGRTHTPLIAFDAGVACESEQYGSARHCRVCWAVEHFHDVEKPAGVAALVRVGTTLPDGGHRRLRGEGCR